MKQFLPHIDQVSSNNGTNDSIQRGHLISQDVFDKITLENNGVTKKFGNYAKDVIEFSVFSQSGDLLGWKTIDKQENFSNKSISFTDKNDNIQNVNVSYLNSVYPTTSSGDVIISL